MTEKKRRKALDVVAGPVARQRLAEQGWDPELFGSLLGASGGPKWLVLGQLDRALFGSFLARRETPLHVLGTSIGSWRHACLAQDDPVAAIGRLEAAYIEQRYDAKPSIEEITKVSRGILDTLLGEDGDRQIVENGRIRSHIGTARGRGPAAGRGRLSQLLAIGAALMLNAVHRRCLQMLYQRVIFDNAARGETGGMAFTDFSTLRVRLTRENLRSALMASGSIPLVLEGETNPRGAPPGQYWDGGIIDYHHDLRAYAADGLVLYPHFYDHLIPGWFDKAWKHRRPEGSVLDRVVILSPSEDFVRQLPGGKIPDRTDFETLDNDRRIERWWQVVEKCQVMAEDFEDLVSGSDPLAGVRSFSGSRDAGPPLEARGDGP